MTLDITPLIAAPTDPADWPVWREHLHAWRTKTLAELSYDDHLYRRPDFAWITACFSYALVMMNDEAFYDAQTNQFKIDEFLDEGEREFGGYDAIVYWHAYPVIGFDQRNQFDFYRDMPGGLKGLRTVSRKLHDRNVKVFLCYNPWDTGTRRESRDDLDVMADFVNAIEADGIFLDTMKHGAPVFRAKLDALRTGVVLESEAALPIEYLHDHHMSWAQWFKDSIAPGVLANKWLERRHMMHGIQRWDHDHTDELQTAWMNGAGVLVWENVFGSWVGWNARDRSLLRSMLPVQRRYHEWFSHGEWVPLVETRQPHVYATLWQRNGVRLWTLVNRSEWDISGDLLAVPHQGQVFADGVQGRMLEVPDHGATIALTGTLPPRGVGAFIALDKHAVDDAFLQFLRMQSETWARANFNTTYPARLVQRKPLSNPLTTGDTSNMAAVDGFQGELQVTYRIRECAFYSNEQFADRWPPLPDFHNEATISSPVSLPPYYIDTLPVSNRQFQTFIQASSYRPSQLKNYLRHWVDGRPHPGEEDQPVVYIDLDDARAYARWVGARLPTEMEWQQAVAQEIAHHGQVWEWTESEHSDGRNRFCMLKGGSPWQASGSYWYADGGVHHATFSAKYLLMWPGISRSSTIGFRCCIAKGKAL